MGLSLSAFDDSGRTGYGIACRKFLANAVMTFLIQLVAPQGRGTDKHRQNWNTDIASDERIEGKTAVHCALVLFKPEGSQNVERAEHGDCRANF